MFILKHQIYLTRGHLASVLFQKTTTDLNKIGKPPRKELQAVCKKNCKVENALIQLNNELIRGGFNELINAK